MGLEDFARANLRVKSPLLRAFMAELLGTFVLIAFGDASVAQFVLGRGQYGTFLSVNWCWGIAVAMGVWVSGGVSGGHINPAVSLANCVVGRLSWIKLPVYLLAQYLGAIAASACVYGVYYDALEEYGDGERITGGPNDTADALEEYGDGERITGGPNDTAGIWATYPMDYLSWNSGLGDQVFSTMLLVLCAMAVTDDKNIGASQGLIPLALGFLVAAIGMSFGLNCGYAINPARDLGPRIFTTMAGWGTDPFSFRDYNWFWIPVVGPHLGGICGALLYLLMVGIHVPDPDEVSLDESYEMRIKKNVESDIPPVDYDNKGYVASNTSRSSNQM